MPPRFVLQEHLDAQNATFKFFCTQANQNVVWWKILHCCPRIGLKPRFGYVAF